MRVLAASVFPSQKPGVYTLKLPMVQSELKDGEVREVPQSQPSQPSPGPQATLSREQPLEQAQISSAWPAPGVVTNDKPSLL